MKDKKVKTKEEVYWCGFENGKKQVISKILKFVDKESEFLPDIHSDALLDRLVSFIKEMK